jgi:hypothetical protein
MPLPLIRPLRGHLLLEGEEAGVGTFSLSGERSDCPELLFAIRLAIRVRGPSYPPRA